MKDIPKTFMPLDKGELPGKRVWRLIEDCKNRSTVIAYEARPRSRRIENEVPQARQRISTLLKPEHSKEHPVFEPDWGMIAHPGWSSPAAEELPNLEYRTVVAELTDLIEARAVSLAPVDPIATPNEDGSPAVDAVVIEALQRPLEMGMRQYLRHLVQLDILEDNSLTTAFLITYERARFGSEPITQAEFQDLMRMFAEILRTMKPVRFENIQLLEAEAGRTFGFDDSANWKKPSNDNTSTQSSSVSNDTGSVRHVHPRDISEESIPSVGTGEDVDNRSPAAGWRAPTSRPPFASRTSSQRSAPRSEHVSDTRKKRELRTMRSQNSLASTRSEKSSRPGRSEAGSVVRLSQPSDGNETPLPYTIEVPANRDQRARY